MMFRKAAFFLLIAAADHSQLLEFSVMSAVVSTLFGILVYVVRQAAAESKYREQRMQEEFQRREISMSEEFRRREERLITVLLELRDFQQGQFLEIIKTNQEVTSQSVIETRASTKAMEELRDEIHELRLEAMRRHGDSASGESGIH